tara:strand:- start:2311 stop:3975 length:1665 start_codon:yes stop_codon:yes gene_type:complete
MASVFTRGDDEERASLIDPERAASTPSNDATTTHRRHNGHQPSSARVWRSRALGFTSAFALVLCASYAVDGSFSALRARLTPAERTAMTMREYGDREALGVLRWSSKDGFTAKTPPPKNSRAGTNARAALAEAAMEATIKRYYPHRIQPGQEPFEILFEVNDKPDTPCMRRGARCWKSRWAPIFAFGSVPKDSDITLPTLVQAPLVALIGCYLDAIETYNVSMPKNDEPMCDFLRYQKVKFSDMQKCDPDGSSKSQAACRPYRHGLFSTHEVYNASEYAWDSLKEKVFWRGSDYAFLSPVYRNYANTSDAFLETIAQSSNRGDTIRRMLVGSRIGPRLRAVLTSLLMPNLIDARFFDWHGGDSVDEHKNHVRESIGVDAKERATEELIAKYKYQIDIGGGGGTTWSGLIPKLSMPGVLLHHETSMKDSYFDQLVPWVHYIPVREDLRDLQNRVRWLQEHDAIAKRISANADEWVRQFRALRNLLEHNYKKLAKPLARVLHTDPLPFGTPSTDTVASIGVDVRAPSSSSSAASSSAVARRRASRRRARGAPRRPS